MRDKVQIITGVVWTPNALSIAPLVTEAKVPFIIMNAGTAMITKRSPYIARTSFTLWQSSFPMGTWAAKRFKTAYVAVADFGPGHDAQEAFTKAFTAAGGKVDRHGAHAAADHRLRAVPAAGEGRQARCALRVRSGRQECHRAHQGFRRPRPRAGGNQADRARRHRHRRGAAEHGRRADRRDDHVPLLRGRRPAFEQVVRRGLPEGVRARTRGRTSSRWARGTPCRRSATWCARRMARSTATRRCCCCAAGRIANSPRGPIEIDPRTRDIVQNEYVRETRKVGGIVKNVELETIPMVKDPWKEFDRASSSVGPLGKAREPPPAGGGFVCPHTLSPVLDAFLSSLVSIAFHGLAYGMILYAISVGLSITMGLMGFVNLAHGVFAMAGGYLMYTVMTRSGCRGCRRSSSPASWSRAASMVLERLALRAALHGRRTRAGAVHDRPDLRRGRGRAACLRHAAARRAAARVHEGPDRALRPLVSDVPRRRDRRRARCSPRSCGSASSARAGARWCAPRSTTARWRRRSASTPASSSRSPSRWEAGWPRSAARSAPT